MNRSFHVIVLVLGVLAPPSEAVEDAEHQHVNAPVERSGLSQVTRGDGFDPRPLHDLPMDIIPEIVLLLDQSLARRLNDPYIRNTNNIENYPMYMLALKLEQHRVELLGSNRALYDQAIESLVKSIDGRAEGYNLDELLKLNDQRVRKALERSKKAEEKAAPRIEAWWKVFARLQAANGGFDPDPLPPDFEQQVDAELARMLEAGEVQPYHSSKTGIPSPPKPGEAPVATASEMVNVIATSDNWSPWQWTALGGILALVGWAAWRRLAMRG